MSSLSTYRTLLSEELGTSETTFLTQTKRDRAINQACRWIGNNYKVPDLLFQEDLTFTTGRASIPSRWYRQGHVKAYDSSTEVIYPLYDADDFDSASLGIAIDYSVAAAGRRILVLPTTVTSLRFRYYRLPLALSASTDDSGLPAESDIAVAKYASYILLVQKGEGDQANFMFKNATYEAKLWANTFSDSRTAIRSAYLGSDYLAT